MLKYKLATHLKISKAQVTMQNSKFKLATFLKISTSIS